jgi:hypothetical protein
MQRDVVGAVSRSVDDLEAAGVSTASPSGWTSTGSGCPQLRSR